MYHQHCTVLSLWLSSTLHALHFWYSQPPDSSHKTLHCWFPRLFCFQSINMEWPSPSSLTEALSVLIQIKSKNMSFPKIVDLQCFLFHVSIHSKSPGRLLPNLSCIYLALYSQNSCVHVCARVLRIVSGDKILRFKNTFKKTIIIIIMWK